MCCVLPGRCRAAWPLGVCWCWCVVVGRHCVACWCGVCFLVGVADLLMLWWLGVVCVVCGVDVLVPALILCCGLRVGVCRARVCYVCRGWCVGRVRSVCVCVGCIVCGVCVVCARVSCVCWAWCVCVYVCVVGPGVLGVWRLGVLVVVYAGWVWFLWCL